MVRVAETRVSADVPADLAKRLRAIATAEQRTVAAVVRLALAEYVERQNQESRAA